MPKFRENAGTPKFSRKFCLLVAAVSTGVMFGCAPPPVPPTALTYQVTVPESRKIAMVAPSAPLATIADIEKAARTDTGCRATAIDRVYQAAGSDRDVIVPSAVYRGFGGRIPVTLECR
jgi:hypothetical protein